MRADGRSSVARVAFDTPGLTCICQYRLGRGEEERFESDRRSAEMLVFPVHHKPLPPKGKASNIQHDQALERELHAKDMAG